MKNEKNVKKHATFSKVSTESILNIFKFEIPLKEITKTTTPSNAPCRQNFINIPS